MALSKSPNIPEDAVMFKNEGEASHYMWNLIFTWHTFSDTWALRYGAPVLGAINAMSGIVINRHYRTRFRLGKIGYLSAGIPIFVMPGLLTALFHNYVVSTEIVLMKKQCPVCYELRASLVQTSLGLVYPMALAPSMALMLASRYSTYRVPELNEGPKAIIKFLRKHTKSLTGTLAYLTAIQVVASSVITYFEMKNYAQLTQKLQKIENEIYKEHGENKPRDTK